MRLGRDVTPPARLAAHIEQVRKRGAITEIGPADDPEIITVLGRTRERWVRIKRGFYERVEVSSER